MIRPLQDTDLHAASAVCMRAFLGTVAPSLSSIGVGNFRTIAAADGVAQRTGPDSLQLVYDDAGVIKGVGEALLAALIAQANVDEVTVSAWLPSVAFFDFTPFARVVHEGRTAASLR